MSKSILFVNQSSGYLMIDVINAHVPFYENIVLFTGFLNPRETPIDNKVSVVNGVKYNRSNAFLRFMSWFVFWFQSLYLIFLRYRNYKVYFVSNPPLNIFSARFLKRDFAFLVYDIYPQALEEYNYLRGKSGFYKYWTKTNKITFNKAKRLFTISESMRQALTDNGIAKNQVQITPIWTNNAFFQNMNGSENAFKHELGINQQFVVGYSGNLGMSHPLEILPKIAHVLRNHSDIMFLIIGEGDKKEILRKKKNELNLDNLKILDYQPTHLFPQVLASFNIGVITLDSKASHLNVPSKTYNLMSAGKPILSIASKSSELSKIINTYGIGRNFSENQIQDMCDYILELKSNTQLYDKYKNSSKKASLNFSSENAKKMILN